MYTYFIMLSEFLRLVKESSYIPYHCGEDKGIENGEETNVYNKTCFATFIVLDAYGISVARHVVLSPAYVSLLLQ